MFIYKSFLGRGYDPIYATPTRYMPEDRKDPSNNHNTRNDAEHNCAIKHTRVHLSW